MYKYTVAMGNVEIDLDQVLSDLKDDNHLQKELEYVFGLAGTKFIVDTIEEKINQIKEEENPSKRKR